MKKVLLLDFDGVVLRNKVADVQVVKRAGIFTWKACNKIPRSSNIISVKHANELCYNLYKGYGHTLTGLKAVGVKSTLADYNHIVYSTIDYPKVRDSNNDFNDIRQLLQYCAEQQILIYTFSNAPELWINSILKTEPDILQSIMDIRGVLGIKDFDDLFLKPRKEVYDAIDERFNAGKIYFVDDNMVNFQNSMCRPNWTNILFSNFNKKINNNMYIADGTEGVMNIL